MQLLQSNALSEHATYTPVSFKSKSKSLHLELDTGLVFGKLDPHYSQVLGVLRGQPAIEMQTYVVHSVSLNRSQGRAKKPSRTRTVSQTKCVTLSVVLYGTMDVFEAVGEFLLQCSGFLQYPLRCDRNVPYCNPQSLSGTDEDPPMTFQFLSELPYTRVETTTQGADPSAPLETEDSLLESETPAAIQTPLYE